MEFATRLCRPGDEKALSLVAQATILETYAGIADGDDLTTYVTAQLSAADFRRILASDRMRAWIAETTAGKCAVGYALQSLMKTRNRSLRLNSSGSTSSTDFTGTG